MISKKLFSTMFAFIVIAVACTQVPQSVQNSQVSPGQNSQADSIQILNLQDGSQVVALQDPEGKPFITVSVQVNLPGVTDIWLKANGEDLVYYPNTSGEATFTVDMTWYIMHGDGIYDLEIMAFGAEKEELGSARMHVQVSGVGVDLAAQEEAQNQAADVAAFTRILELFQSEFGLALDAPPVARKQKSSGTNDPWASNVYWGSYDYQIYVYPDGMYDAWALPLEINMLSTDKEGAAGAAVCTPKGEYSLLIVFVDYGNLGVSAEEAALALEQATALANAQYGQYTSIDGTPILQLHTQAAFIPVPADMPASRELTADMISTLTGFEITHFDWLVQVDLDAAQTARLSWGTLEQTSFGYAMGGCDQIPEGLDIWVNVDDAGQLFGDQNRLTDTLLIHEVLHLFGYPGTHSWVCNDGTVPDPSDCCGTNAIPSLELGWTDTDGDGTPEILDTVSPYGLISP